MDPLAASGRIEYTGQSDTEFLGTCAGFRHPHIVLTAAHCVRDVQEGELQVHFPERGERRAVVAMEVHPSADIAIVTTVSRPTDPRGGYYPPGAFLDATERLALGEEVMAYGYPGAGPTPEGDEIVVRLFRGHCQRLLGQFRAPGGYLYEAAELNVAAPAGLSGGPVFRPGDQGRLLGLVTTSADSYTIEDSVEEQVAPGDTRRTEVRRVVSYGVVLLLDALRPWLDSVVPPREGVRVARGGVPSVETEAPLEVLSERAISDPRSRAVHFEIQFNRPPHFFVIDDRGRQEDSFDYAVWLEPRGNRSGSGHIRIRAGEVYVNREIEIAASSYSPLAHLGPVQPGVRGGWGPLRGRVPYRIDETTLTFEIDWNLLGTETGTVFYELHIHRFGGATKRLEGQSVVMNSA